MAQFPYRVVIEIILQATGDDDFQRASLDTMSKEFSFWLANRTVDVVAANGKSYKLARYNVQVDMPRPGN